MYKFLLFVSLNYVLALFFSIFGRSYLMAGEGFSNSVHVGIAKSWQLSRYGMGVSGWSSLSDFKKGTKKSDLLS